MKKGILTFIFLSLFLVNLNIVKAVSCEDLKLKIKYGSYNSDGYYDYYLRPTTMQLSDGSYRYPQFDMVDDAGTVFSSFCRNPNANVCDNKGNTFVCNSEVFEPNEAEIKKTYDAGILAILRGGYSHNNPPTAALTKSLTDTYGADAGYSATSLALRVYEMLWISNSNGKANNNIKNGNRPYNVNKNYTILWRDGEDADEYETRIINAANQINSSYLIPAGYYKGTNLLSVRSWTYNGKNIKDPVEKAAKELIALGLEAALDYQKNGVATLTWNETPVDKIESQETLEDGSITYKRSHTYNFKLEKFDADDAIAKINSITCTNCSSYNVDYTVYVNDEEVGKTFPIDLKAKKDSNNQVKIKIEFTGNTKNYDCSKIDYKINIGYYDDTISTQAFNVTAYGQEKNIDCQEFYLLNAVGVEREAQIANNVKLCNKPTTCKDLEKECTEDHDEDACEEWEDKYEKDCSSQGCTTFVSDSTCKIDASQINIKEGYELGENVCETPENLNVLSCIIDKKDKAGNSYKATNLVDNKYCSVFCKEDYHIELPGDREVNSGRYFSLKASIGGTKTCYSNKIDKETFEIDFKEANQAIITAYNNYQFYNAVVNGKSGGAENRTGATLGTHSHPCGQTCRKPAGCDVEANDESEECKTQCTTNYCSYGPYYAGDYKAYIYSWSFQAYEPTGNGSGLTSIGTLPSIPNTTCSGSGSITCTYKSEGSPGSVVHDSVSVQAKNGDDIGDYSDSLRQAKNSLNAAINKLKELIKTYNSCSEWVMNYNFDPEITFDYEEEYMDIALSNKLESVGSVQKDNVVVEKCAADTDNAYNACESGWTDSELKENRQFFSCSSTAGAYSCGMQTAEISKVQRMKETIKANGEYITPTQFFTVYSTGAVVSGENAVEGTNPLENKLPVGLNTPRGRYSYSLKVDNLGEYYDTSSLGRIWGSENSVVTAALADQSMCIRQGSLKDETQIGDNTITDGVYVCEYTVNCPNCPVVCEGDNCWYDDDDCPNGKCPVVCEGCLYDSNDGVNISYRPITSTDINPNDRDLGANWKFDDNIETALELKAFTTTKEIEEAGDEIYDEDAYTLKITLDTRTMNKIRDYNTNQRDNGGYTNNTLKCYSHKNSNDGKTYDNVYCYSSFIDELLNDDQVDIDVDSRRLLNENERKAKTQQSGYWTAWSDATSKWNISTELGIQFRSNYDIIGVGPSWK